MRKIKERREGKNITQEVLAASVGVTQAAISAFESGDKVPRLKTLRKIAIELECTVNDLLDDNELDQKTG